MAILCCPLCGSRNLKQNGDASFFDGRPGFRCTDCGADLAPPRPAIGRAALLVIPLFAVLFGVALIGGALFLFFHELPCGQVLGFAGLLAAGAGVVAMQHTVRELRKPRPGRHQKQRRAKNLPQAPLPVLQSLSCPPDRLKESRVTIGNSIDVRPGRASRGSKNPAAERVCHFHLGPEGVASGLGGIFPIWFILVMVASLIVFKDFRQDHFLYRSPCPEIIAAAVTAVGSWLMGRYLNRRAGHRFLEFPRDHRDPATGALLPGTYGHTFFFVRLEYCGLFAVLFYAYICLGGK